MQQLALSELVSLCSQIEQSMRAEQAMRARAADHGRGSPRGLRDPGWDAGRSVGTTRWRSVGGAGKGTCIGGRWCDGGSCGMGAWLARSPSI